MIVEVSDVPQTKGPKPKPPPNWKLKAARKALPSPSGAPKMKMSRRELAEAANAYVWKHTRGQQRTNLSAHDIGRYERNEVHWPDEWRRYGLRGVLGVSSDKALGFYPTRDMGDTDASETYEPNGGNQVAAADSNDGVEARDVSADTRVTSVARMASDQDVTGAMLARAAGVCGQNLGGHPANNGEVGHVLPGSGTRDTEEPPQLGLEVFAGIAARESWEHLAMSSSEIGEAGIEHVQVLVRRLAHRYHELTPIRLLAEARNARNLIYRLLERTNRLGQMADLYLTAGQACGLLAMASFDLAQWDAATDQIRAATKYADLIDHAGLRSWSAGTAALIAYWSAQPRQALVILDAAANCVPPGVASARLGSIRARAWSYLGDVGEVMVALEHSDRAMEAADGADDLYDGVGGELGWGRSVHQACAGTALLQIGHPEAASRRIRAALDTAPGDPHGGLVPPRARVDLATAELATGRLDAALDALTEIWQMPAQRRRYGLTARLEQVRHTLSGPRWRCHRPAAELRDRIEAFVGEAIATRALPAG